MSKSKFTLFSLILILIVIVAMAFGVNYLSQQYFTANNLTTKLFGLAIASAIVLWGLLQLIVPKGVSAAETIVPAKKVEKKPEPQISPHASAVQLLSIFQREGRLIDFLQEDLSTYDDAQIGAAVRNIHEGSKKALRNYFTLEPIRKEPEGSEITVQQGFDAKELRLVGNVAGEPPFKGTLMHRGWKITKVNLPRIMPSDDGKMVLAAAEIEVTGQ